jgi:hypothetical protein
MNSLRVVTERSGELPARVRTFDMGGKDSTLDVAKAIADYASS